ncbi:MAG: ATP-binding cassette domain-containing protein [Victivallaceae bacterium]|nr:ATP-binding cassette domain-containing protein [Victivallaceae bacterium]
MIDFQNITKSFSGKDILKDISFRVNPGERVGVVGPNGSGKSTIFNMITGTMSPDSGHIAIPNDHRIGIMKQKLDTADLHRTLLEYTSDAMPELPGYVEELREMEERMASGDVDDKLLRRHGILQDKIEHLGAYHLEQEAKEVLSSLGFAVSSFDKPMSELSGGWQMRASLARVLISHPDTLLLDEPSNYLDVPAVEWLCHFLDGFSGTLILISHDRFLLRKLARVILEVNQGHVTRYAGGYDYYRTERENRCRLMTNAKLNQDRERERMERVIDRFRAKSTKAAQAKSWQKKLDKMEILEAPDDLRYHGAIRFPEPPPAGTEAARFEDVSFGYSADKMLFEHVSIDIASGDKLAFIGYNGLGKTTLLKLLAGKLVPSSGRVVLGHHCVIGYQAQEFSELLSDEQTVYDAVRGALPPAASTANLMNVLGSFGFPGDESKKPVGVLSGGERIRVQFARIFVNPPNLLILDEPTTHLDLAMRELLQEAICSFKGTVCLVSHDIEFVRATATGIVSVTPGKVRKFCGDFDYFEEKNVSAGTPVSTNMREPARDGALQTAKERRQQRAHARQAIAADYKRAKDEVARLEKDLDERTDRKRAIEFCLAGGGKVDFAKLRKELAQINDTIVSIEERWEKATADLEALRIENDRINSQ